MSFAVFLEGVLVIVAQLTVTGPNTDFGKAPISVSLINLLVSKIRFPKIYL